MPHQLEWGSAKATAESLCVNCRKELRCSAALYRFGTCVKEDEIKANKNHIKEYYSLTAISHQVPVSF